MKLVQDGFSLIELIIVVAVIGIIAAIAIPNLLAARASANESSAISSLRTFHEAQATYQTTYGDGNFAGTVGSVDGASFSQLGAVTLIDPALASGTKSGYKFTAGVFDATAGRHASYCARGVPVITTGMAVTGKRNFAIATDGVVYEASAVASTNADCDMSGFASVVAASPLNN